jgi:nitrate reductase NapAB chaperone NapD
MIFTGSLVNVLPDRLDEALEHLEKFEQVEVFTISDDKLQIVVAIEAESEDSLELLCKTITASPAIIAISHHYFNFEEEVESIIKEEKIPDLKGFGKKKSREFNN